MGGLKILRSWQDISIITSGFFNFRLFVGWNLHCLFYFLKVSGFPRKGPYFVLIARKTFFYIYKHNCKTELAPGVRIVEKKERGGNACEICFQKVIPPTLSASNPNVVSGVKSCQSSNGRQTALFTELKNIYMPVFIFYICFLQTNISFTSKNERPGKYYLACAAGACK